MKTVFIDVDTQLDFIYPAGALYVPGAEKLLPVWTRLAERASSHEIPVISTMDAHSANDSEFRIWPHHCVDGTLGQRKPQALLLGGERQILVKKKVLDPFASGELHQVLSRLAADRYVLYGVVTEICVRLAGIGLLKLGKPIELVTDAVKELDQAKANETCGELGAAGVVLTTAEQVLAERARP